MMDSSPKICILIMLLIALIDSTEQTDLFEGSICELHTGEVGVCKDSQNCKWLIQNLQKKKMKFGDIKRCLFTEQNQDIVCCGDEHPNKPNNNFEPCQLGFLFDDLNCSSNPWDLHGTSTEDGNVSNIAGGQKVIEACERYSSLATSYSPWNIINGKPAGLSEYPHMVALGYLNTAGRTEYDFDCGGSLIADNWIVTAAHCIKERRQPVMVRMGKISLYSDEDGVEAVDRTITRVVRHPKYSFTRKKDDIALVQFSGTVEFNDIVRPACIRTDVADIPETQELIIAGWGSTEAERTNRSEILLKANVSSVLLDVCNRTLVEYNRLSNQPSLRALSETQMCALNPVDRSDACQGDSGGPIFQYHQSGVSTIVGIVSFGVSCGSKIPAVYTRIASYVNWIENVVWP